MVRRAGLIGQRRAGEGFGGHLRQPHRERFDQPCAALHQRRAMLHHLRLDRVEPAAFGLAQVGQQPVALAQCGLVACGMAGMRGIEREREPVDITAAVARGSGEQPVHCRGQPGQREPFAERGRCRLGAADPHAAAARMRAFAIGGEADRFTLLQQAGADAEAGLAAAADHVGQGRAPQSASRGEQRQRLEHIRLPRAVFTHQQVEARSAVERARGMVAKVGEGDAVERHGSHVRIARGRAWGYSKGAFPTVGKNSQPFGWLNIALSDRSARNGGFLRFFEFGTAVAM